MDQPLPHVVWLPGHEILLPDAARAENCYVWDSKGKKYLDLESGVWCTSVGHNHPRLRRVMLEQSAQIAHTGFNYGSGVVEEASLEILELLGFRDGACAFLCSGSEAVEYGVRTAQSLTDRPLLMTMADSYFGAYGSAASQARDEWYSFDWFPCENCDRDDCNEDCEHWAAIPFDRIGGFLLEPGSSSGLVRFPPEGLIRSIVNAIRAARGLILVNEVTTGIGRTGRWFGHQHYSFTPDIVAMGKGIGGGYPVAVTAFNRDVKQLMGGPIKYAQSHQNDPLGAAIARETIRIIDEDGLIERGREIGEQFLAGLRAIGERVRSVKAVRGRGLMAAVELHDNDATEYTIRVHRRTFERGFLIGRRAGFSVLRLDPSLTIDPADIARFLSEFEEVLEEEGT